MSVVISSGQKLVQCETDIKNSVKSTECLQKSLLQPLHVQVKSVIPLHNCCTNCKALCNYQGNECHSEELPFTPIIKDNQVTESGVVSKEDEEVLEEALKEYQMFLNSGTATLLETTHALIRNVVSNAAKIYTLEDILCTLPIFSTAHARFILGFFQDISGDIEGEDELVDLMDSALYVFDIMSNNDYLVNYFDNSDSDGENPEVPFFRYTHVSTWQAILRASRNNSPSLACSFSSTIPERKERLLVV